MSCHRLTIVLSVGLLLGATFAAMPTTQPLLSSLVGGLLPSVSPSASQTPLGLVLDQRAATAFAISGDATMTALATTTGRPRGRFSLRLQQQVAEPYDSAVADESTGHLFVATEHSTGSAPYAVSSVRMIDVRTGAVLRVVATGATGARTTAMAIDQRTDHVIMANTAIGTGVSSISMVDGRTGALIHTISLGSNSPVAGLAVASREARLFVATWGGLDMLDARTGAVVRTLPITPGYGGAVVIDEQTSRAFYAPEVWAQRRDLDILDARTGTVVDKTTLRLPPTSLLVDEQTNRVLIPTFRGGTATTAPLSGISVLDARTGHLVHQVVSPDGYFPIPMGSIAVDPATGQVLAVTPATLSETQQHPHGLALWLDGRTGSVLRGLPVGHNPARVAIDSRTGYAFVANQGDSTVTVLDVGHAAVVRTVPLP